MPSLADLQAYGRFALGLPSFLRRRMSVDEAREVVLARLADRQRQLRDVVRLGVYGNPTSPYRALLDLAGCELGDFERLVEQRGVEGALDELRREGVYVTFEELKGRRPIVRHGREIAGGPQAFANPFASRFYQGTTGGSTGPGTRIHFDLDHMATTLAGTVLGFDAHGVREVPTAVWRPVLPSVAGLSSVLRGAPRGRIAERWFSPIGLRDLRISPKDRLAIELVLLVARLSGRSLPRPQPVPFEDAAIVARWVRGALDREGRCLLQSSVSSLLRVALAAEELGIDFTGATFWGAGEPPTDARVAGIRATGARYVPTYYLSEVGAVGLGCADPWDATDVHFMADALALVQHPVAVPGSPLEVPAILLTSLLPTSPMILLNAETDDFGLVETRPCGCPLGQLGLTRHIRQVASYRKLTGEGMSLVGSDMVRVLEEVLPSRFGGTPLDFQLVQEEEAGLPRLVLVVHPRLAIGDEDDVRKAVLTALGRGDDASVLAAAVWSQAASFVVRREEPVTTAAGKFLPLRAVPWAPSGPEDRPIDLEVAS